MILLLLKIEMHFLYEDKEKPRKLETLAFELQLCQ